MNRDRNMCRICLKNGRESMLSIFDANHHLEIKLQVIQLNVTEGDSWPQLLCEICAAQVDAMYILYTLAKSSEKQLEKWYGPVEVPNCKTDFDSLIEEKFAVDSVPEPNQNNGIGEEIVLAEAETLDTEEDNMIEYSIVDDDEEDFEDTEAVSQEEDEEESPVSNKKKINSPNKSLSRQEKTAERRQTENEFISKYITMHCVECHFKGDTFEILMEHYNKAHKKKGAILCCDYKFNKRQQLLDHAHYHADPDRFACPVCNKRYMAQAYLRLHMRLHRPPEECAFPCVKCPKRFATLRHLTSHEKIHVEGLNYSCQECGKSFKQQETLDNHRKSVHERAKSQICEICAKVFYTREGFRDHVARHTETPTPRLKCEVCKHLFKNHLTLRRHMKWNHPSSDEPQKKWPCDRCSQVFSNSAYLARHKKCVHEAVMHKCDLCEKAFKRTVALREHMATHTGQVLYTCSFCPKQFKSNANKYSHQKNQHPDEWQESNRRKHMQ